LAPAGVAASVYAVTATVDVGSSPVGAAADTGTPAVYVVNLKDNTVSVIDENTNTVTHTVGVGGNPYAVALDAGLRMVYVTNTSGNTVSVIDEATNTVTHTIAVGAAPNAVAVDGHLEPNDHQAGVHLRGKPTPSATPSSHRSAKYSPAAEIKWAGRLPVTSRRAPPASAPG
jgi:YVTN family beta-propeller protein